ncbi:MAG TPA: hypothetical protein VMQ11_19015 [Alphaproteobacteria bacterium]|nr:hypothetical protein [Alphaproteobacteria bacterium]
MSDDALQYSFESDAEYLTKLQELVAAQAVRIRVDPGKLRGMDSPVVVIAETERWALGMVVLCGLVWWFFGMWFAGGALVLAAAAYALFGRRAIHRNIERRIHEQALKNISTWRALWQFGGVTLESAADAKDMCAAPAGRWISFVERRIASSHVIASN